MGADVLSEAINIENYVIAAIQAVVSSGTLPVGDLILQASCDDDPDAITNWTDISGSTQGVTADGTFLWNESLAGYSWIRLFYDRTSGSGTLNARMQLKG
jgi:hypothetical protein